MYLTDEGYRQACLAHCRYDYASAVEHFSEYLKKNPYAMDVHYRRCLAYAKLGFDELAIEDAIKGLPDAAEAIFSQPDRTNSFGANIIVDLCTRLMQVRPDRTTMICLGLAYICSFAEKQEDKEQIKMAQTALSDLLAKFPDDAMAYYFRGLSLDLLKSYDEAERDFQKAAELDAKHRKARMQLAYSAMRKQNYMAAAKRFSDVLQLNDTDGQAYVGRAEALIECYEFKAALNDLERALDLNVVSHEVHYLRGVAYSKLGNLEAAATSFAVAEDVMVKKPKGLDSTKSIWLRDDAKNVFFELIRRNPNDENAFLGRGLAFYLSGQPTRNEADLKRADDDYARALDINPNCARAYYLRALNHWIFSPDEARKDLEASLKIDSNNLQALMLKARMRGGTVQDLSAVIERAGDDKEVLDEALTHALLMARDNGAKVEICNRRIAMNLGGHREFGLRATAHMAKGDFASAIEDLTLALALNPHNLDWMLKRAEAYQQLGYEDEASRDANEVIELTTDPDIKRRAFLLF